MNNMQPGRWLTQRCPSFWSVIITVVQRGWMNSISAIVKPTSPHICDHRGAERMMIAQRSNQRKRMMRDELETRIEMHAGESSWGMGQMKNNGGHRKIG